MDTQLTAITPTHVINPILFYRACKNTYSVDLSRGHMTLSPLSMNDLTSPLIGAEPTQTNGHHRSGETNG